MSVLCISKNIGDFKLHQFYKEKYMNFFGVLGYSGEHMFFVFCT